MIAAAQFEIRFKGMVSIPSPVFMAHDSLSAAIQSLLAFNCVEPVPVNIQPSALLPE